MVSILVLDDDNEMLQAVDLCLSSAGYNTHAFSSSVKILEAVEKSPLFDLAILDINVPILSGVDVAHSLIQTTEIPFMFLSAYSDHELVERCIALGAFGYIVKTDFEQLSNQLLATVPLAIARAREARQNARQVQESMAKMNNDQLKERAVVLIQDRFNVPAETAAAYLENAGRARGIKPQEMAKRYLKSWDTVNLGFNHLPI